MKRSVAVIGPTPSFLRWAIWHQCSIRPLYQDRFADRTFRHLRAVRELAVAQREGRCSKDVCVHPGANETDPANQLGFTIAEVTEAFGGIETLEAECQACPANVVHFEPPDSSAQGADESAEAKNLLAGCYGFLPTNSFSFDRLLSGHPQSPSFEFDLVSALDHIVVKNHLLIELQTAFGVELEKRNTSMPKACANDRPWVWYQLWKSKRVGSLNESKLEPPQLIVILRMFQLLIDQWDDVVTGDQAKASGPTHSILQFRNAIARCVETEMPLVAELIPSGHSDGYRWSLSPSCPECRFEPQGLSDPSEPTRCLCCGWFGPFPPGPKFKVLGLRPYVHLAGILGKTTLEIPNWKK